MGAVSPLAAARRLLVARPCPVPSPPVPDLPADLALGAFSDHPPWIVELDQLAWRAGLDEVRRATRAEVPALTRRRRLPPGRRVLTTGALLGAAVGTWWAGDRRRGAV